jgi:hypothetical protein
VPTDTYTSTAILPSNSEGKGHLRKSSFSLCARFIRCASSGSRLPKGRMSARVRWVMKRCLKRLGIHCTWAFCLSGPTLSGSLWTLTKSHETGLIASPMSI